MNTMKRDVMPELLKVMSGHSAFPVGSTNISNMQSTTSLRRIVFSANKSGAAGFASLMINVVDWPFVRKN